MSKAGTWGWTNSVYVGSFNSALSIHEAGSAPKFLGQLLAVEIQASDFQEPA